MGMQVQKCKKGFSLFSVEWQARSWAQSLVLANPEGIEAFSPGL
jgi:hypothetical protein